MSDRLLETYQKRVEEILPQLKLEDLAVKIVPRWLLAASNSLKSATAAERLPGLLAQSPSFMLDNAGFSQSVDALDEFVVAGMGR